MRNTNLIITVNFTVFLIIFSSNLVAESSNLSLKMQIIGKGGISDLSFSPDEKAVAVGYSDGTISVFEMKTQKVIFHYNANIYAIKDVKFSSNGESLYFTDEYKIYSILKTI